MPGLRFSASGLRAWRACIRVVFTASPRCGRGHVGLIAIALALVDENATFPEGAEFVGMCILNQLALYRQGALAATAEARHFHERELALCEKVAGPDHPGTATSLNNLGYLLRAEGDLEGARPYYERALAIREKALGPDHPTRRPASTILAVCCGLRATLQERGCIVSAHWRLVKRRWDRTIRTRSEEHTSELQS